MPKMPKSVQFRPAPPQLHSFGGEGTVRMAENPPHDGKPEALDRQKIIRLNNLYLYF